MSLAPNDSGSECTSSSSSQPQHDSQTQEMVDKCTKGLLERFEPAVQGINTGLEVINVKQSSLSDLVAAENEKYKNAEETFQLTSMVERTNHYHQKLVALQKEMTALSDRSASMKARSMKLMEAKQKEALKREQKRQREQEREEQLVARPAASNL